MSRTLREYGGCMGGRRTLLPGQDWNEELSEEGDAVVVILPPMGYDDEDDVEDWGEEEWGEEDDWID